MKEYVLIAREGKRRGWRAILRKSKEEKCLRQGSYTGWINDYVSKHLLGITMKPTGNGKEVNCDGYNVTCKHVD